jgi:predicted RNase H-like nuclease (RuvC/YqgF family)
MSEKRERKIKTGELENVKAVEEVTRRNVESGIQFANDTRRMVLELRNMFDALQSNVMNMKAEQDQLKSQLANLQQQFYARGSVSYSDDD